MKQVSSFAIHLTFCFLYCNVIFASSLSTDSQTTEIIKNYIVELGGVAKSEYQTLKKRGEIIRYCRTAIFYALSGPFFTDSVTPGTQCINKKFSDSQEKRFFNEKILNSYPLYYTQKNELGKEIFPEARVGVFLWAIDEKGEVCILFSQAPKSDISFKSENYGDLGGALCTINNLPETFLEAGKRVTLQQTGGVLSLESETFLDNGFTYFRQSLTERQIAIIFIQVPYQFIIQLKKATSQNLIQFPQMKQDYLWIHVKSIFATLATITAQLQEKLKSKDSYYPADTSLNWGGLKTSEGQEVTLKVRAYIPELLKDKAIQDILKYLLLKNK